MQALLLCLLLSGGLLPVDAKRTASVQQNMANDHSDKTELTGPEDPEKAEHPNEIQEALLETGDQLLHSNKTAVTNSSNGAAMTGSVCCCSLRVETLEHSSSASLSEGFEYEYDKRVY